MDLDPGHIRLALTRNGLVDLPAHNSESLANYGLDSLMLALLILDLEKTYSVRVPTHLMTSSSFASIEKIANLIETLLVVR